MVIVTKKGEVVKTSVVELRTQEKNNLLNCLLLKYSIERCLTKHQTSVKKWHRKHSNLNKGC